MNKIVAGAVFALSASLLAPSWAAEGGATEKDAIAMVKKGLAAIKAGPKDKVFTDIGDKANATYRHEDLYLVVYQLDGVVLAHGANPKFVGRNMIDLKDIDGKAFVKERVELAKSKGTFWQDYKFTNPETKKVEPKSMYCERLDDMAVCGGIYK